jgi:carbon monoxide dehydrogenase subunit G
LGLISFPSNSEIMTEFKSELVNVNASDKEVFDFLGDFTNFEHLMPPQIKNWSADADHCSFTIDGLADLSMKITTRNPNRNISIAAHGKNPIDYVLDVFIFGREETKSQVEVIFNASLNVFIKSMASRPLQNFVDMLAMRIQQHFES